MEKKNRIWKKAGLMLAAAGLLGACANEAGKGEDAAENTAKAETGQTVKLGILQIMEHESLSAARKGFLDVLAEAGYKEGENLQIDYQNAQGDQANLQAMADRLSGSNDLILAIATPSAQSIANVEKDIPILFTAVTDPVDAGLVESLETPGSNLTGTTDAGPIEEQVKLLLAVAPDAEKIGMIYNSSEPNSVIQSKEAEKILEKMNKKAEIVTVTSTNDVQQAMESLAQRVEGVYIPTDNTLASAMATVSHIAQEYQLPVVAAAAEQVMAGGLATYGIDYYELGKQTGKMAIEILEKGLDPKTMAVQSSDTLELVVNEEMAKALGIDPDSIVLPE